MYICCNISAFSQEYVYVSVEKADLKEGTGFFSEKVTQIDYGTRLLVLENTIKDKWIQVTNENNPLQTGWILSSNVTTKRILNIFSNTGNSDKEIALAGKGFTEGEISTNNANYEAVNELEKYEQNPEELKQFIIEGKLKVE